MAGMVVTFAILLALIPSLALGADDDPVLRVGNGVSTPKVLHKVNPEYSSEAKREGIQGTALYTVIVDKGGKARDVELLSPIGYGLDEKGFEEIGRASCRERVLWYV